MKRLPCYTSDRGGFFYLLFLAFLERVQIRPEKRSCFSGLNIWTAYFRMKNTTTARPATPRRIQGRGLDWFFCVFFGGT